MEIAEHHNITVPKQPAEPSQIIDALISNTAEDICLDMEGEYKIPKMMQYDSLVFTDYDFAEPLPQSRRHNNRSSNNNRRSSQNSRRNTESTEQSSSIGDRNASVLMSFLGELSH